MHRSLIGFLAAGLLLVACGASWLYVPSSATFLNAKSALFTSSDSVDLGNVLNRSNTDAWSVTLRVKLTTASGQQHLVRKALQNVPSANAYRGYQQMSDTDGSILLFLINTYGSNYIQKSTTTTPLDNLNAHCIGLTVDGTSTAAGAKIYADGAVQTASTTADTLAGTLSTTASLTVGTDAGDAQTLRAYYDELTFYNRALTAIEMSAVCTPTAPVNPASVIADFVTSGETFLRFDTTLTPADAYNGTIYDRKGSNNGTPSAVSGFIVDSVFL